VCKKNAVLRFFGRNKETNRQTFFWVLSGRWGNPQFVDSPIIAGAMVADLPANVDVKYKGKEPEVTGLASKSK